MSDHDLERTNPRGISRQAIDRALAAQRPSWFRRNYKLVVAIALAVAITAVTWIAVSKSSSGQLAACSNDQVSFYNTIRGWNSFYEKGTPEDLVAVVDVPGSPDAWISLNYKETATHPCEFALHNDAARDETTVDMQLTDRHNGQPMQIANFAACVSYDDVPDVVTAAPGQRPKVTMTCDEVWD